MTITYSPTQFTTDSTYFYSPAFRQSEEDTLLSVGAELESTGTVTLQCSINSTNWSDITDSTFTCDTYAIQSYYNAHLPLIYRLKTDIAIVSAQVII